MRTWGYSGKPPLRVWVPMYPIQRPGRMRYLLRKCRGWTSKQLHAAGIENKEGGSKLK